MAMALIAFAVLLSFGSTAFAVAGADPSHINTSVFAPNSPPSHWTNAIFILVLAITFGIMIVVGGAMTVFAIKFRKRKHDNDDEPPQMYGSLRVEAAWTLGPLMIVFVLFLVTFRVVAQIQTKQPTENSIHVTVIAKQWWWEFKYPELGITTANELHVPVGTDGKPVAVFLTLKSADVIHSFWVPRLAPKQDVVPGHPNPLWFSVTEPGIYYGQCAEFCGSQHANMKIRVVAQTPENFKKWVKNEQKAAAPVSTLKTPLQIKGEKLFMDTSCINCHSVKGTIAKGTFGPDLTHLMSRATIGAGVAKNTHKNLISWVHDAQVLKPKSHMPDMHLTEDQTRAIVAYLETLK